MSPIGMTGTITFAPAARVPGPGGGLPNVPEALAAAPPAGRQIRLWYCHGGGSAGNVAAGTLTVLKDPVAGMQVTNPVPATGGRDAESVENALVRGPRELHSLERAVTARDFELLALAEHWRRLAREGVHALDALGARVAGNGGSGAGTRRAGCRARRTVACRAATMAQYETEEVRAPHAAPLSTSGVRSARSVR